MDLAENMGVEWWDGICCSKCPDADVGLSTHVRRFLGQSPPLVFLIAHGSKTADEVNG